MIEMDNIMVSLFLLVCVLASSSEGHVTGTCGTEELRRAAVSEGLASVGCDSYICSKFTSYSVCMYNNKSQGCKISCMHIV